MQPAAVRRGAAGGQPADAGAQRGRLVRRWALHLRRAAGAHVLDRKTTALHCMDMSWGSEVVPGSIIDLRLTEGVDLAALSFISVIHAFSALLTVRYSRINSVAPFRRFAAGAHAGGVRHRHAFAHWPRVSRPRCALVTNGHHMKPSSHSNPVSEPGSGAGRASEHLKFMRGLRMSTGTSTGRSPTSCRLVLSRVLRRLHVACRRGRSGGAAGCRRLPAGGGRL